MQGEIERLKEQIALNKAQTVLNKDLTLKYQEVTRMYRELTSMQEDVNNKILDILRREAAIETIEHRLDVLQRWDERARRRSAPGGGIER